MELSLTEKVKIAYKKLKSSVYFDKTQMPLRDMIVDYEYGGIDSRLSS